MLNKEALLSQATAVQVTLSFWGGMLTGSDWSWTDPDGTQKHRSCFDERVGMLVTFICKYGTLVKISTSNYKGTCTAVPNQEINTQGEGRKCYITFTATQNVKVTF